MKPTKQTLPSLQSISSLPDGTLFYFTDKDLSGGVNRLTCYRKTRTGYTNLVTRCRSLFAQRPHLKDALVAVVGEGMPSELIDDANAAVAKAKNRRR